MILSDAERRLSGARRAAAAAAEYLVRAFWDDHLVTAKGTYDLHLSADTKAGPGKAPFGVGKDHRGSSATEARSIRTRTASARK